VVKAGFAQLIRGISGRLALGYWGLAEQQRYPTSAAIENQPFELSMKLKYDSAGVSALDMGHLTCQDL
jgi:hypothetical protein